MRRPKNSDGAWEALCEQCGLCCFEKIEDENGTVFFTATPCRYLDVVTRQCVIYDRRFDINPECIKLTEDLVRELHWLHDGCAYRKALGLKRSRVKMATRPGRKKKKEFSDNGN
ncbi:MAG: YcgN family cysteine cluster protein [Desulfuromonadales bacterium]|nr:MAG: YcgN family cysteine cluster protein [Desulfuromonadales bacterium]